MTKFKGVIPALVSPLNADETINSAVLKRLTDDLLQAGADGFYIGGATGEGIALNTKERMVLAETAVDAVSKRKPCIVHVASTNFNDAILLSKHAEEIGADAISAIPPLFFQYDEDDVYNYYKALANAVHIPLMIYFNPAAGFSINAKFAARMFEVDNITAIKWTSSDYYGMMELKDLTHGEMNIINGPDEMLLMGLSAGADGGIGTTYNFMLPLIRGVYDNFIQRDMEKAQQYQTQVSRIISAMRGFPCIPATKAILEQTGYAVGDAAFPQKQLTAAQKDALLCSIRAAGWNDETL